MSPKPRLRTALFINAHSRRGRRLCDKVISDFTRLKNDFDLIEIIVVKNLKQLDYHLDVLKSVKKLDCVIVGSGDGTIVAVLNAMKDRDITYGFLPLGTSNTFVRSLGLPLTYPQAKKVIMKRTSRPASLGSINGKLFANIAGIGVPEEVTRTTTNKIKKVLGPLAYVVHGIKAIIGHDAILCHVVNDDINESFYTHYLLFANGKYHGNIPLGKDVSAFKGELMLMAVGVSENRRDLTGALLRIFFRRHENDKRVKMIPFQRLHITTQPNRSIEADGEIISKTPATVEIKQDAIKVFIK